VRTSFAPLIVEHMQLDSWLARETY